MTKVVGLKIKYKTIGKIVKKGGINKKSDGNCDRGIEGWRVVIGGG